MSTDKTIVHRLVQAIAAKGVRHCVVSPGSRNAPLVIAFSGQKTIMCLPIVDERSAAFFALGIAQQTGVPVALVCTSGSAVLNYGPAIAEAYYQKVPLLILTADRPTEWIDQDDGQTLRQVSVFSNFIKASFTLPPEPAHKDDLWYTERISSEAMNIAVDSCCPGPVHINIPLREPLYGESDKMEDVNKKIDLMAVIRKLDADSEARLSDEWGKAKRRLIICGMHKPDAKLNRLLSTLAGDSSTVVMTETTSNMADEKFVSTIDGYYESLSEKEKSSLAPDLLITFGGPVTTKKFKAYLRKYKPASHWHVAPDSSHIDTYQSLTKIIPVKAEELFSFLARQKGGSKSGYSAQVRKIAAEALARLIKHGSQIPFSDLKAFLAIWKHLQERSVVHLGNSTPIRYANLMESAGKGVSFYSNRGLSGIDGTMSTASGSAFASGKLTTLIVGDLGFRYDMNALWNENLPSNLRIVVINNGGGGIFRIIDSKDTPMLEKYFEAAHFSKMEPFVKAFGIPYYSAFDEESIREGLSELYNQGGPAVLEIFTPRLKNAGVLLDYFKSLKK